MRAVPIASLPTADSRVTEEMSDTLQKALDDPRCKQAGITDVTISSTSNGQHGSPEDRHYQGKAVDIAEVNGKPIKDDATAREQAAVMQKVIEEKARSEGNIKDNIGPSQKQLFQNGQEVKPRTSLTGHNDHVHIAIE